MHLNTEILTEQEKAILDYMGKRRVKRKEIRQAFKMNDRHFYEIIRRIRRKGFWIIASKQSDCAGYYMTDNEDELDAFISKQVQMYEDNMKTFKAMKESDGKGNNR